jgi:site-specific recombinase XerD
MHYAAIRPHCRSPPSAGYPTKTVRPTVLSYLTREQVAAMLAAPDRHTWSAHRDAALLTTAYKTGACLGTHRTART